MNRLLVVDPSVTSAQLISQEIKEEFDIDVLISNSLKQTIEIIENESSINVAVVDPSLVDDKDAEIIDLLIEKNIPTIMYASPMETDLFDTLINKSIVDYVLRSNRNNFFIVINLIGKVLRHDQTAVLVVDDSRTDRMLISAMLSSLNLHIIEVNGVQEALQKIKEHPEIKLLLTDYNMEGQNGVDLTSAVRKHYSNKEVSIIGNSSHGNPMLSAEFLKNGANAFISKPFQKEELLNMVLIQLDMIDYIETIKNASEKDFLTGIYNRKYVYEVGRKLFDNAKRGNITMACAMIDIDHFKKVNDTYGHDIGDKVIIRLAEELNSAFRDSDIVGRIGGEEFCVILASPNEEELESLFDKFRKRIEELVIVAEDEQKKKFSLNFTISIGLTSTLVESFEEMMKYADLKLYEAKNYGRNMVVL